MPCCNTFYLVYSALHSGVCSLPSWWSHLQAHSMKFYLPYTGHGWKFWIAPDWASEPSVKLCWKHVCSLTVVVIYYLQFFSGSFCTCSKVMSLASSFPTLYWQHCVTWWQNGCCDLERFSSFYRMYYVVSGEDCCSHTVPEELMLPLIHHDLP